MLKSTLHSATWRLERLFGLLQAARRREAKCIDAHFGYATKDSLVLRGRVLADRRSFGDTEGNPVFRNVLQSVQRFLTREVAHVPLRCAQTRGVSDEEGYFQLEIPRNHAPGWQFEDVVLPGGEATPCPAYVPQPNAPLMLISDIDDTVLHTRAWSLLSNLWTTFSGNVHTRKIFDDAVALYARLHSAYDIPIFYVSSSPWNLHGFLTELFKRSHLPSGPMFLRDLGVDRDKFVTSGHGSHKGHSIDLLMAANPDLPAILAGDSGQKDARIYREAILRHPGRVRAVLLRTPGPGLDAADQRDLEKLRATGVPVFAVRDFGDVSTEIENLISGDMT